MKIKNGLKKASRWLLPPKIEECFRNHLRVTLPHDLKRRLVNNKKFHNIHKGQRCFILATGPSINKQDLTGLQKEFCIAVGSFYLHKDVNVINPLYHVESPIHPPFGIDSVAKITDAYNKYYTNKTIFFMGHSPYKYAFYNALKSHSIFEKTLNINFLNYAGGIHLDENNYKDSKYWDITKTLFACRTVVYSAIQVAAYMGFKEIYLLGCDHDYLSNYLTGYKDHHFYKDEEGVSGVADYLSAFTLEKWFEEYYYRWKQYRLMGDYLEAKGCKIYNATDGGMLDVFPRVRLTDIVNSNA